MITKFNFKDKTIKSYAIRKLTPLECFRLMGVRDAVIHIMQSTIGKAKAWLKGLKGKDEDMVISASQQYKQAGNSIIVDVLKYIYEQLWYPKPVKPKEQFDMFDSLFPEDTLPSYPQGYDPQKYWLPDGSPVASVSDVTTVPSASPLASPDGVPTPASEEKIILTTFSGYDSQLMAADALKEDHPDFRWTCAGWSDIDKYACQMHNLIFPQFADKALGDITKIDWHKLKGELGSKEIDLFTYSSPCQDISQAGKQMGLKEGSGSRSALLWNVADAVEILRPKFLLQENVAALVSEKFMPDFQLWLKKLESLGYVNRWALLNGKDYGVPQNRLRVFCLSMRKDVAFDYQFPEPFILEKRLEDILEEEVDEKYFLKDDAVSKFLKVNDNDSAVFVQFSLPPTHEDAMFLKTYLHRFMNNRGGVVPFANRPRGNHKENARHRLPNRLAHLLFDARRRVPKGVLYEFE